MSMAYILITPAKDEEDNLSTLIESVANQTLKPVAWFIVDDNSEDKTPEIIERATSQYPWLHSLRLTTKRAYDLGEHYAFVCIKGFEHALEYCQQNDLHYEYIALSDADMIYSKDYFAECIKFLQQNGEFGIVSGKLLVKDKEGNVYEESTIQLGYGEPFGTGRVWRNEAFVDTDGYTVTKAPDSVSNIKALLRGWKIKRLSDVICYQTRCMGGKYGLWNGFLSLGERAYYINQNPLSILNRILDIMLISRPSNCTVRSLGLLSGYCKAFFSREEQTQDDEVRAYFGSYKRVMKNYWLFLKELMKK